MINGKTLLGFVIAVVAASTLQLATADLTSVCAASGGDPNGDGAGVCYDTTNGLETNFTGAQGPASYTIQPDGNPGHEFISETATAPGRSAAATADMGRGLQRAYASSTDSPASAAGAHSDMGDTITFHNSSSQPLAITVHYHIHGRLSIGTDSSAASYSGRFYFESGGGSGGGEHGGDVDFSGQRTNNGPDQNFDSTSIDVWNQQGSSYELVPDQAPASGFDFTGHMFVPPGDLVMNLFLRLGVTAAPAGPNGLGTADFGNTASLTFDLPPEVTFTSASGQLLTDITAVSRKNHAGTDHDIDLPLSGTPGIECRQGPVAGEYQIVVSFANPISQMGMVNADSPAQVQSTSLTNGTDVTVNLTDVPNEQTTSVTLHDVHNGAINGDVVVPMSVLVGDVNAIGGVDGNDVAAVQSHTRQPVNSDAMARFDVNATGNIDGNDVAFTQTHTRTSLHSPQNAFEPASKRGAKRVSFRN